VLSLLLLSHDSVDVTRAHLTWVALAGNVSFFLVQAALTNRVVRKNYRSFRVVVLRSDGQQTRSLSARESMSVWLWVMGPQVALILITSVIVWCYGADLLPAAVRSISTLSVWLRFLAVGPYALGLALRAQYRGFRLKACGYRYV
jgi:hypothetical protein